MGFETKVTSQGQITLSKSLRKKYLIKGGDSVSLVDLGDHIVILPKPKDALKMLLSFRIKTRKSIGQIKREINETASRQAVG